MKGCDPGKVTSKVKFCVHTKLSLYTQWFDPSTIFGISTHKMKKKRKEEVCKMWLVKRRGLGKKEKKEPTYPVVSRQATYPFTE